MLELTYARKKRRNKHTDCAAALRAAAWPPCVPPTVPPSPPAVPRSKVIACHLNIHLLPSDGTPSSLSCGGRKVFPVAPHHDCGESRPTEAVAHRIPGPAVSVPADLALLA